MSIQVHRYRYCAAVYLVGYTNSVTVRDPLKSVVGIVIIIVVVVVILVEGKRKLLLPTTYVCLYLMCIPGHFVPICMYTCIYPISWKHN